MYWPRCHRKHLHNEWVAEWISKLVRSNSFGLIGRLWKSEAPQQIYRSVLLGRHCDNKLPDAYVLKRGPVQAVSDADVLLRDRLSAAVACSGVVVVVFDFTCLKTPEKTLLQRSWIPIVGGKTEGCFAEW